MFNLFQKSPFELLIANWNEIADLDISAFSHNKNFSVIYHKDSKIGAKIEYEYVSIGGDYSFIFKWDHTGTIDIDKARRLVNKLERKDYLKILKFRKKFMQLKLKDELKIVSAERLEFEEFRLIRKYMEKYPTVKEKYEELQLALNLVREYDKDGRPTDPS